MPHNYNESTTLHAGDYPGLVARQERDVTPRRVWVPDESDVYTGEELAALNALARELGWWELGGSDA